MSISEAFTSYYIDVRSTEIPSEDIDALAAARPELIIIR